MEYWLIWLIVVGIGFVVALLVHTFVRMAQGPSMLITLVAGIVGALAAAALVTPNVEMSGTPLLAERYIWAAAGALVLSLITELLFVGTRRGRVISY